MSYVAVKGGEQAILNTHKLLSENRRGSSQFPELSLDQIREQFSLAVARVMSEGSVFDPDLAALALKQAQGDTLEAIFLVRAYRTTLPRLAMSKPVDTARMAVHRRISAAFKDVPGGQVLGPTYDYTHRLIDFTLAAEGEERSKAEAAEDAVPADMPRVIDFLDDEGVIEAETDEGQKEVFDLTRQPMKFPAGRDQRLQNLARGDEGFLLGLAYSTIRGYGYSHPYVGELRVGDITVEIEPEELGFPIEVAEITVTECQMVASFKGSTEKAAQFTRGYGLSFGHNERKAMSMGLLDRALRARELGEDVQGPAQDEEFVLPHTDNVDGNGMVSHFKLPHYVDFQADLQFVRQMRTEFEERRSADATKEAAE